MFLKRFWIIDLNADERFNPDRCYFRFSTVWHNHLKNKHLAEYLGNNNNELATMRFSAFCGAVLSNNSLRLQKKEVFPKNRNLYSNFWFFAFGSFREVKMQDSQCRIATTLPGSFPAATTILPYRVADNILIFQNFAL